MIDTLSSGWNLLGSDRLPASSDICTFLMLSMYFFASVCSCSTLIFCAVTTPLISSVKPSQPGYWLRTIRSTTSANVDSFLSSLSMPKRPSVDSLKPLACLLASFMKLPISRIRPRTLIKLDELLRLSATREISSSLLEISSYSCSNVRVSANALILLFQ
jgi:hypothetical protein